MIRFLNKGGSGTNTSDATATADDILSPKTAYVNNKKIKGTIETKIVESDVSDYYNKSLNNDMSVKCSATIDYDDMLLITYISSSNLVIEIINNTNSKIKQSFPLSDYFTFSNPTFIAINKEECNDKTTTYTVGISKYENGGTCTWEFKKVIYDKEKNQITLEGSLTKTVTASRTVDLSACRFYAVENRIGMFWALHHNWSNCVLSTLIVDWKTNTITYKDVFYADYYTNYTGFPSGNQHWISKSDRMVYLDYDLNSTTQYTGKGNAYISPDSKYMCYSNVLYGISPSNNFNTIFNNKVKIIDLSYSEAYFSKNSTYLYTKCNDAINIYKIDGLTATLTQTISLAYDFTIIPVYSSNAFLVYNKSTNDIEMYYYDSSAIIGTFICKGLKYLHFRHNDIPSQDKVLQDIIYKNENNMYQLGTMPNNGELNYTPSDEEQIIPVGYTDGGIINSMDITASAQYKNAMSTVNDIMPIITNTIYKQVEYIQGTGTQRLYTDIETDSAKDTYEITLKDTNISNWEYYFEFGAMRLARYQTNSTAFCLYAGTNRTAENFTLGNLNDGNYHTIRIAPNAISFDGVQKLTYSIGGDSTGKINIFYPGDTTSQFLFKELKIHRDGTLIHKLIPYKNVQTLECGVYDIITNVFYNNTGTGEFTTGDIIKDIAPLIEKLTDIKTNLGENSHIQSDVFLK